MIGDRLLYSPGTSWSESKRRGWRAFQDVAQHVHQIGRIGLGKEKRFEMHFPDGTTWVLTRDGNKTVIAVKGEEIGTPDVMEELREEIKAVMREIAKEQERLPTMRAWKRHYKMPKSKVAVTVLWGPMPNRLKDVLPWAKRQLRRYKRMKDIPRREVNG